MVRTSTTMGYPVIIMAVSILAGILSGCVTAPEVVVKMNDIRLPNQAKTAHLEMNDRIMDVSWYYIRTYDRVIRSRDGNEETIRDQEPLTLEDVHALPYDTKSVGIVLLIENPTLLKYRLSKIEANNLNKDGATSLGEANNPNKDGATFLGEANNPNKDGATFLYYEGIKEFNEVFVAGVLPSADTTKLGIKVELVGNDGTIADSVYVGDLLYYTAAQEGQDKMKEEQSHKLEGGPATPY